MSKSIKLKENTYWDSTSITHNKELLSTKVINSSGSNSNGSWIKFEDGTMICYKKISGTTNINLTWYSLYRADVYIGLMPCEFVETPTITYSLTGEYILCGGSTTAPTKKNFGGVNLVRPNTFNGVYYEINAIAIGKWK